MRLMMDGMRLSGQVNPVIAAANNRYVTFSSEKININAQDYHNDAEKNTMRSLFSEELSLDIYKHDIHFDQKAFQSGMLKIQFPNDNEKLSVYLKNKIPFENITIEVMTPTY